MLAKHVIFWKIELAFWASPQVECFLHADMYVFVFALLLLRFESTRSLPHLSVFAAPTSLIPLHPHPDEIRINAS